MKYHLLTIGWLTTTLAVMYAIIAAAVSYPSYAITVCVILSATLLLGLIYALIYSIVSGPSDG
jgi:hypothetical protein